MLCHNPSVDGKGTSLIWRPDICVRTGDVVVESKEKRQAAFCARSFLL